MATKSKKRRAWASEDVRRLKAAARKKRPASVTLRTKSGRRVITSPAKSATSLASWSAAFGGR
jgi:hypothetical protein